MSAIEMHNENVASNFHDASEDMRNPRDKECQQLLQLGFEDETGLNHWVKRDMPGLLVDARFMRGYSSSSTAAYGWSMSVYCVNTNKRLYADSGDGIAQMWMTFLAG
jgi:hypothetical protein